MTQRTSTRRFSLALSAFIIAFGGGMGAISPAYSQSEIPGARDQVLRVCADPNNLPISNEDRQGFENKIAELFAKDLGWKLEFTWFPQRMAWVRNTLRAPVREEKRYKCDLIMGVPEGFDQAATTQHYYRSTYAAAYVKGKGLDGVKTPDDLLKLPPEKLKSLRFGVFSASPPGDWLLKHNLFEQAVPYQRMTGDPKQYPGEMIEKDLVEGKIDVALAWGPIAGYYAKSAKNAEIAIAPFKPDSELRFDYAIAMGVRRGENEWREMVEKLIAKNQTRIDQILLDYGVPLIDDKGQFITVAGSGTRSPLSASEKGAK